ncbi:precorrin-6A/cobalt-precorrin-6A reductase [Cyanobium sp. Morenito 9A2]|uniref:precorrin-6A/cobalt-precorrin-6A reductase n=1 Tax=Cyanobium sp. Morenito 9A2 TaxID=2823718 RepID=UPI0020CDD89F|nr:precorrin-6A/cobalt-precorrin-6A reductase [Cyanobium sp. Morenito 9A2]MCP9849342.1 precorrin-6A/cobalt-precorrin-6A reductase [Cyanobium sp. Morenito 9A2]
MPQQHLWLVAGTGEGPPLAATLLDRGWQVRVNLVSSSALRAYAPHPRLELESGALGGEAAIEARLAAAVGRNAPFDWVVDASHPFAQVISAELARVCQRLGQPLLRLRRETLEGDDTSGEALGPPGPGLRLLADLADLGSVDLRADRLLLAIGARRLAQALAASNAAGHGARLLPSPAALRLARAVGLSDAQIACHRPTPGGGLPPLALERALCRQWGITAVLARQSGGTTEATWRQLAGEEGLKLLLIRRPPEPAAVLGLPLEALLEKLGFPTTPP